MSIKVEINIADAETLAILKKMKAAAEQSWDVTLKEGMNMKIQINYNLNDKLPIGIINAVNTCISNSINAIKSETKDVKEISQ